MDENLKSNDIGLKDGIKRMKNKFNEYWPKFKDYALVCMILDPRFKLYFLVNLNEKKEAKDLFVSNYNKYHSKSRSKSNQFRKQSGNTGTIYIEHQQEKRKDSLNDGAVF